jgi:phage shock protein E
MSGVNKMLDLLKRPATWLSIVLFASLAAISLAQQPDIDAIPEKARIVDVRTPSEFRSGHFPGAANIPLADIPGRLAEFGGKDLSIVVYCLSGNRSGIAKRLLEAAGYKRVSNGGGLDAMMRLAPGLPRSK